MPSLENQYILNMSNAWSPEKNDFGALKGKVVVITGEILLSHLIDSVLRWAQAQQMVLVLRQ